MRSRQARRGHRNSPFYKTILGGENVSEKEKALVEQISKMPADLKEKFILMAEGAALALEKDKKDAEQDS